MLFRKSMHLAAMLAAVALTTAAAHASSFQIVSEKSRVRFEVGHHDYAKPVKGRFHQLSGKIEYDVTSPGYTSMQIIIDPSSVDTDNQYRDSHLRSSFFEVEQFPEIRFQLTQARLADKVIEGKLTIKGVTHPVTLDISRLQHSTAANGMPVLRCRATTIVNRRAFGVAENTEGETGLASLVSHIQEGLDEFMEDVVEIHISITAHATTTDYADGFADAGVL